MSSEELKTNFSYEGRVLLLIKKLENLKANIDLKYFKTNMWEIIKFLIHYSDLTD